MNVALSAAVVLFAAAAGLYFSKRLKEREKQLSAALLFVKELSVQIRYTNSKICSILNSAACSGTYQDLFFIKDCAALKENEDFHPVWDKGVKKQFFLHERDRELLSALGERLGETDCDGQIAFLEMTEEMMKKQCDEAHEEYKKKSKMYRSVGLLCGLALGIMVL